MSFCKNCGTGLKENSKFCPKCGNTNFQRKIESKHDSKISSISHKKTSYLPYIWVIVILILFAGVIFPTRAMEYSVEVPYESVEYYTEKEPYEVQEAYEKQVPYEASETYIDTVPIEKDVAYVDYKTEYWDESITNCDSSSYCSCTGYNWWTGKCNQCHCSKKTPVTKYKKEIINQKIEKERAITKYKTVIDYKTVTKYKDVEKSRPVMKTKIETKTKKINWLFGFEVPW